MTDEVLSTLRLDVLRLVHRHDHSPAQMIERGDALMAWITGQKAKRPRAADKPPA